MATKKNGSLTLWDEKLAKLAEASLETVSDIGVGRFISLRSGVISWNGTPIPGNKINVAILDAIRENDFYKDQFNQDSLTSPICYALGRNPKTLRPHELSPEPQHETCSGCPHNEFGSSERGQGKACGNRVRMGMITEGDLENIAEAEIAFLKIPPTSLVNWANYLKEVTKKFARTYWSMITEVSVVPDPKSQFKVVFRPISKIDNKYLTALQQRVEQLQKEIEFPYAVTAVAEEEPVPAKKFTGKGARK